MVRCGGLHNIYALSYRDGGFVCSSCYRQGIDSVQDKERLKKFRILCKAKWEHYEIIKEIPFDYDDFYMFIPILRSMQNWYEKHSFSKNNM